MRGFRLLTDSGYSNHFGDATPWWFIWSPIKFPSSPCNVFKSWCFYGVQSREMWSFMQFLSSPCRVSLKADSFTYMVLSASLRWRYCPLCDMSWFILWRYSYILLLALLWVETERRKAVSIAWGALLCRCRFSGFVHKNIYPTIVSYAMFRSASRLRVVVYCCCIYCSILIGSLDFMIIESLLQCHWSSACGFKIIAEHSIACDYQNSWYNQRSLTWSCERGNTESLGQIPRENTCPCKGERPWWICWLHEGEDIQY